MSPLGSAGEARARSGTERPRDHERGGGRRAELKTTVAPAVLVVVLLWAGSYSAIKAAQVEVPPLALATFRCLLAAGIMLAGLCAIGRWPRLSRREWGTVALIGIAGHAAFHLCLVGALAFTTPAHAALLVNLSPLFATLLAAVTLGERLGVGKLGGVLLALAGLVVIAARDDLTGGTLLGDLLSVGAALAWTVYSVAGKSLLAAHPPLQITALALVLGTPPLLLVGGPAVLSMPWRSLGPGGWLLLAYLSVGTIVVAYVLWYWALARASTARVLAYSYLTPLVAAVISVVLGQDAPSVSLAVGAVAIVAGVALTQLG